MARFSCLLGLLLLSLFAYQVSAQPKHVSSRTEWETNTTVPIAQPMATPTTNQLECDRYGRGYDYYDYDGGSPPGNFNSYLYERIFESRYECEDATSAVGGSYSTFSKMCVVSFHKSSTSHHKAYELSDVCADENELEHMNTFLAKFPDSCVGQFGRCYELETQSNILARILCAKSGKIPTGTTHVSVDCTADAAESKAKYEVYKKRREREHLLQMVFGIGIPVFLLLCCAGACFRYRLKLRSFARTCQEKWNNSSNSKGHDDWTICSVMCCGILIVMKRLRKTPEMSGLLAQDEEVEVPPMDNRISRRFPDGEVA